jgi:hypothetical protein
MLRKNIAIIIILSFFITFMQLEDVGLAAAADSDSDSDSDSACSWLKDAGWKIIGSEYCTIILHPDVDMEKLNNKIKIRFYAVDKSTFSPKGKTVEEQLAEKIDRIFTKVERVMDMYPDRMHLNIKIFQTQAQLDEEYAKIFSENDGMLRISYYIHKYSTIFTTEQAIREGVVAHEMGHAISDHYFLVKPSEKIKELLAQYAEIHLEE